jgi:biopolymer transport protein ExbD
MNFSSTKEPLLPHLAPEPDVMMDINTTPLIDILLVLIIMLIITIPAQLHSVNLDMPVSPAQRIKEPRVIKISIDDKSNMSWNGSPIESQDELDARFSNIRLNNENIEIHIRSSARARYDTAIKVLASAQRHEIKKIGIVGLDEFNL